MKRLTIAALLILFVIASVAEAHHVPGEMDKVYNVYIPLVFGPAGTLVEMQTEAGMEVQSETSMEIEVVKEPFKFQQMGGNGPEAHGESAPIANQNKRSE